MNNKQVEDEIPHIGISSMYGGKAKLGLATLMGLALGGMPLLVASPFAEQFTRGTWAPPRSRSRIWDSTPTVNDFERMEQAQLKRDRKNSKRATG